MTSSEKQTETPAGEGEEPKPKPVQGPPSYATARFWLEGIGNRPTLLVGGLLLVVGWGFALHINRWHLTVPVIVLWLGWAGVLATVRFLWDAGVDVASEVAGETGEEFNVTDSRRQELLMEKKSLLVAIKEIEFDRDMGKMSEADADQIMRFYRKRAIQVIKELDGASDDSLSVAQRVERDLQARLQIEAKIAKKPGPHTKGKTANGAAKNAPAAKVAAKGVTSKSIAEKPAQADESASDESDDSSMESA